MAKILQLKFKNEVGKQVNLSLNYVNENLSPETVQQAMTELAALQLFRDKAGNLIYQTPIAAKYVETTETAVIKSQK